MAQGKVLHSFAELADHYRFEQSKKRGGGKPSKLPPPPKQPAPAGHAKPAVKGRVNARRHRG